MTIPRPDNIADIGDIADSKARLRQQMRARRRQIPPAQQAAAAEALCQRVIAQDFFTQAQHIAFYSATDGEINPRPLLEAALKAGKRCYLPIVPAISPPTGTVLHPAVGADTAPQSSPPASASDAPANHAQSRRPPAGPAPLLFAQVTATTPLQPNRWHIPEPPPENLISPEDLHLVFLPLVAFDDACNRLGMGKAFYDRTFAFCHPASKHITAPRLLLVGLAHESQHTPEVPTTPQDLPLHAIITPQTTHHPSTNT